MITDTNPAVSSRFKIPLAISTGYVFLRPDEIISFQSDGSSSTANLIGAKPIKVNALLKQIEDDLPPNFFRCHKSHIINLNYMSEYNMRQKCIVMEDASVAPLSRRKVAAFNAFLQSAVVAG